MVRIAALLDCYIVEPSGLGVPPSVSTYARSAFGALTHACPDADVRYLTIDDVRWCRNGGRSFMAAPLTDPLTYSATASRSTPGSFSRGRTPWSRRNCIGGPGTPSSGTTPVSCPRPLPPLLTQDS